MNEKEVREVQKKPYQTPALTVHGTVQEITAGWGRRWNDFFFGDDDDGLCHPILGQLCKS
ncbi:MAG: lasso peptide [Anaerolineae bacterium]|nr:lasso peptide [Anaerolineae bacterium]